MVNGLATYALGQGSPLLLMPHPHGLTSGLMAESFLAHQLVATGRRVVTFDPPGAYRSTREPYLDMREMLVCAHDALDAWGVRGAVDVMGHGQGGLCALFLAVEQPEHVSRLVLVGGFSGAPAIRRFRGLPWHWRWWRSPEFGRFQRWSSRLGRGRGNLATHKRLFNLVSRVSYADRDRAPQLAIDSLDQRRPPPLRDRWWAVARRLDCRGSLERVSAPTLLCVGRYDPQAPVACSIELQRGIAGARLAVFEHSGHSPFVEEPGRFAEVLEAFLC